MPAGSSNKLQQRYLNILNLIPFLKLFYRAIMQKRLKLVKIAGTDGKKGWCGREQRVPSGNGSHVCQCAHVYVHPQSLVTWTDLV